jgi:hypothetical protein
MRPLLELLKAVKEEHLNKTDLENLRDEMAHLYSLYQLRTAELKKQKALFLMHKAEKTNVAMHLLGRGGAEMIPPPPVMV